MKNPQAKLFKKKTSKLYRFNPLSESNGFETTVGDPTNTTITILTTVSHQSGFGKSVNVGQLKL
ncbi:hypothetical protein [Mucilaginibacter terrae]|uniref:Uncharacterized protein n=1 Tax=Mucilaginibacter terrae TaxID=1955052 RepID=A0ABU3GMN6_9SPHI|nr:hypothetical protein [Mucilaginibacter terrae]MDT3401041.1 hypothetical protein [Mucilaginibacter terrae]